MKLRADDKGRLTCLELFPPNAIFDAERQPDGSIRVVASENDAPFVKPIRTKEGFLMLPARLDRRLVAVAIRAERDAR